MKNEAVARRQRFEGHVRELAGMGHRGSATAQEREAAERLRAWLQTAGLDAELQPFMGASSMGARLLIHVVVALLAVGLVPWAPLWGAGLGLVALVSLLAEGTTRVRLLSAPIARTASHNVVATVPAAAPTRRIVVLAHYDTQRTGVMWNDALGQRLGPLLVRAPGVTKSPLLPVVAAMALVPALGLWGALVPASAVVPWGAALVSLVLLVAAGLLADWARGPFVPGANDNATGTAAAIALAERWSRAPVEGVELVCVLTGCEETGLLGAAAWADRFRARQDRVETLFLNLDSLGYGAPRFIRREHSLAAQPVSYPDDLVRLCAAVAAARGLDTTAHVLPVATDGLALLQRGMRGVTLLAFENGGRMANYHQRTDTAERLDFDVAWATVELAWDVLLRLADRGPAESDSAELRDLP